MPVIGLSTTVETALTALLTVNSVSSWKLAGWFVYLVAVTLILLGVFFSLESKVRYLSFTFLPQHPHDNLSLGAATGHTNNASEASASPLTTNTSGVMSAITVSVVKQSVPVPRNEQKTPRSKTAKYESSPPKWRLFRSFEGRLGNVLFQLSSALCIARLNNLTLVVKDVKELHSLRYRGPRVRGSAWEKTVSVAPIRHPEVAVCCRYNTTVLSLTRIPSHHSLTGYFQSWKYLEPCKAEVKEATLFKDSIVTTATGIVQDLRKTLPHRTLVGMHVRREDMLNPAEQKMGRRVAPPDYFLRAMTYFRDRFGDVNFVVVSSTPDWFRTHVSNSSEVLHLSRSSSPAVDMEVLSRMDHMIVSVGTFGWWCAYKNNGAVVYYKDSYVPGTRYGRQLQNNVADYFPPHWIPM